MQVPSDEDNYTKDQFKNNIDKMNTEVIRISKENYEMLRTKAYLSRKTIRQLADEILTKELKKDNK